MRKLLMWIVVTVGIAALVRKLRRHGDEETSEVESAGDESPADDPADELRRKLRTRDDGDAAAAPAVDDAAELAATIDERRTEVHEEGRAAIDEMQQSTED
jgi:hypothetical protein